MNLKNVDFIKPTIFEVYIKEGLFIKDEKKLDKQKNMKESKEKSTQITLNSIDKQVKLNLKEKEKKTKKTQAKLF